MVGRYSVRDGLLGPERGTLIVIDSTGRVEVPGLCPARRARFVSSEGLVTVRIRWRRCAGIRRAVRLTAVAGGRSLAGEVLRGAAPVRTFLAPRSSCRDGVLDVEGGEACDDGVSPFCASGGYCSVLPLNLGDHCSCASVPEPVDEVEPNDDVADAMAIEPRGSFLLRGSIASATDVDTFAFSKDAFVAYVLDETGTGCDGIDPRLLLTSPGREPVFSDDDVFGSCPVVSVAPGFLSGTPVETRLLAVSSANGKPIPSYTLRIEHLLGTP